MSALWKHRSVRSAHLALVSWSLFHVSCFILIVSPPLVFSEFYFPFLYFSHFFCCPMVFTSVSLSVQPWIVLTCVPRPSCIYSLCQCVLSCEFRESVRPGPVSRQVSFYVFLWYFVCLGLEYCYFDTLSCLFLSHRCFFLQSLFSFDTLVIMSSLKELFC